MVTHEQKSSGCNREVAARTWGVWPLRAWTKWRKVITIVVSIWHEEALKELMEITFAIRYFYFIWQPLECIFTVSFLWWCISYFSHLIVSIMPAYRSCLVQSSRSKVRGSLNSLGLIQRTKKGWHRLRVFIRESRERLNWRPRVGDFLRVSCVWNKIKQAHNIKFYNIKRRLGQ